LKKFGGWALFFLIALVVLGPLLWVFMSSLKPSTSILTSPFGTEGFPHWANYKAAWTEAKIGRAAVNSVIVCFVSLAILLPIGSMAAYALARMPFWGRNGIRTLFLGGLMFPNFLAVVPLFLMMGRWQLNETLIGLILVYVAYSLSFTIFVMSGFFETLPKELEEAAQMDGASTSRVFWRVMLPLAKPGLIVAGIFNFIGLWNEYNLAKVLVSGDNATLPIGLANLTVSQFYKSDYGALFAALTMVLIPLMILYWFLRDKVHEAMLSGSIR
jgi:N-acetylglucosamine transport system permease protein